MLKGNKGEWSELYVIVRLLTDGKLFQSDMTLEKNDDIYYEIIKAYKEETNAVLEFERNEEVCLYRITESTKLCVGKYSTSYLGNIATILYNGIVAGKGKSFGIDDLKEFIEKTKITKLTAKTSGKADVKLRIYDHRLAKETDLGFSIKSLIGQNSTLFNTGSGNNFIFKVNPERDIPVECFNKQTYKPDEKMSKISYRILLLLEDYRASIKFKTIQSSQLWLNLKMIDGDLPEILAWALLYRWQYKVSRTSDIISILEKIDPMKFYNDKRPEQKLYEYKIKKFLVECAMGMTSETPWNGIYDATGGVIICKSDGDVVCFHIYDFNLFREYLVNNTIFEQPATGEDENNPGHIREDKKTKKYFYGWLYKEEEDYLFKINLQIRFS